MNSAIPVVVLSCVCAIPIASLAEDTARFDSSHFLARPTDGWAAAAPLPNRWSLREHLRWKQEIAGDGQSSPVVFDDMVFVTSIEGKMKETCRVSAISLEGGKLLWTRQIAAAQPIRANYFQCRAASTPVADSDGVIAFFETGNLVAMDRKGNIRWSKNLAREYGPFDSTIGLASSLAQNAKAVFVLVDHEGQSYLLAVDKQHGTELWRTIRFSRKSFASPAILAVGGKPQLIVSSTGSIDGYDIQSGEQLWSFEDVGANSQNTPTPVEDGVFLIGASTGMHDAFEKAARKSNLCLEVQPQVGQDGGYRTKVRWRVEPRVTSHFASPIAHRGLCYWISKTGILSCYRLANGEPVYRERLASGQCWATPIPLGDRIYFFGKDGKTSVIAAGEKFQVVGEGQLWDESDAIQNRPAGVGRPVASSGAPSPGPNAEKSGPPPTSAERSELRAAGEGRFADPVQYGAAITKRGLLIRSGHVIYLFGKERKNGES